MSNDPQMDRFRMLFRALYDDNEGTRAVAALKLLQHMKATDLHPDKIVIERYGESHRLHARIIEYTRRDLDVATRRLTFIRPHVDPKIWEQAERAGEVLNRWPEIEDIAGRRLGNLKRGWKQRVRQILGVGEKVFRAWELGLSRIPDWVFEKLKTEPVPAPKPRQPRKKRQQAPLLVEAAE